MKTGILQIDESFAYSGNGLRRLRKSARCGAAVGVCCWSAGKAAQTPQSMIMCGQRKSGDALSMELRERARPADGVTEQR